MNLNMETTDLDEDATRQYIDAKQAFSALTQAKAKLAEYRGGMVWKTVKGHDYLIRTSTRGAQKSLGPRSPATEAIYQKFTSGKSHAEQMHTGLKQSLERHRRMNRALRVGRTPDIIIDILNALQQAGVTDKFSVIGTNALYAYETAAGARIEASHLATRDCDLLWDNRSKLSLAIQEGPLAEGMLGLLRRVDSSFTLRDDQLYTAVNKDGYEVDVLRRMGAGSDAEPGQVTALAEDFWAVKARNADWLLSAPKFSEVVIGTSGRMARMVTVDPRAFALFKLWMAGQPDRAYAKRARDAGQARIVVSLISERLPQLSFEKIRVFPSSIADLIVTDEAGPHLAKPPGQR
jgi:hypothetical protein